MNKSFDQVEKLNYLFYKVTAILKESSSSI